MSLFPAPVVDFANPLYCPDVSSHQYLSSIRLFQASVADASKFPYFNRMCNAFLENKFEESPESLPLQLVKEQLFSKHQPLSKNDLVNVEVDHDDCNVSSVSTTAKDLKRGSDENSPDTSRLPLKRAPKRIKRSSSHEDRSFVLSAKAERLRFSDKMAQLPSSDFYADQLVNLPVQELFWPEEQSGSLETAGLVESEYQPGVRQARNAAEFSRGVGPETPRSLSALLKHLEKLLPGIRLRTQLDSSLVTHQDVVDALGMKGHLNPKILALFRDTNIQSLRLTASMVDADGLNLTRHDILKTLNDPASFLSLRSLVLSDVPLSDDDLACLNYLLRLESLFLDDTQIGDIAVMHLTAFRRCLSHLELSWNDRITDDAIPTLCNFINLSFLSLKGTAITMKGLRKLACSAKEREKKISIILPSKCEEYICNQHEEYEVNLTSPLINDPGACHTLSKSALMENLAAHAARNPEILTDGTKVELERRLRKILERRKKDIVVQGFMLQGFA